MPPITASPLQDPWNYDRAFSRNLGLVTPDEQHRLRDSRVAIAGMGGVGGVHLITLTRLGITRFHIADPDHFELPNMNRQYGARVDTLGELKSKVMSEAARGINPEVQIRAFDGITQDTINAFLEGVDLVIDGLDFFAIQARRLLFQQAKKRGIWAVTSGPYAFGATLLSFSPQGMSFDEYFDIFDSMSETDQVIAFAVGTCPRPIHLSYLKLDGFFNGREQRAASVGLACQLVSGITAAEALKILLKRGPVRPVPYYLQFDAYRQKLAKGRLWWGNRHPLQKLKRRWLQKRSFT